MGTVNPVACVVDPLRFKDLVWGDSINFYDKQVEIIYSVKDNRETVVPAGNMLGKDFVSAFIVLWFFLSRHPCKIVTTSADHAQLESVLWAEIGRFIQQARIPLEREKGGPLIINHLKLRKMRPDMKKRCPLSRVIARVPKKGEGVLGQHIAKTGDGIPRTLFLADEASALDDETYTNALTWADRVLLIGNCWPCSNIFYHAVKGGDIPEMETVL